MKTEVHSAKGRAVCIVETDDYIYIFEFKRDGSAGEALAQIGTQGYALPYAADNRKMFKIGVNFDSEKTDCNGVEGGIIKWGLYPVISDLHLIAAAPWHKTSHLLLLSLTSSECIFIAALVRKYIA